MSSNPEVSVVIPAFNEEKRLPDTLKAVRSFFLDRGISYEVIVGDDGSCDRTAEVAGSAGVRVVRDMEKGKGAAVKSAVMASSGEYVLMTDADLSTPITEFSRFRELIRGRDIVIGSRDMPDSDLIVSQPLYRRLMGRAYNLIVSALLFRGIRDTQCGFKLFRREAAAVLFSQSLIKGFSFDVEILFLAKKYSFSVKEAGVKWRNDPDSKVSLLSDPIRMFMDILKIRFYDLAGKY